MSEAELYWVKVGALGQVAGALATFLAVTVSLYFGLYARRPRLKVTVGERLIIGQAIQDDVRVLLFSVANAGERPVHIRGIGWRTGWLRWGPNFLRRQVAVQLTGGFGMGQDPPYELQPGAEVSSYALMDNVLSYAEEKPGKPFFSRDWPMLGRRPTRVLGYAYTADGHSFHVRAEPSLVVQLYDAEVRSLTRAPNTEDVRAA